MCLVVLTFWKYPGPSIQGGRVQYLLLHRDSSGLIFNKPLVEEDLYLCLLFTKKFKAPIDGSGVGGGS